MNQTKKLTSTPDFINDVGHQPRSYPNLLVSLGIVGFHGDPNFLNKTLKHLSQGSEAQEAPTQNCRLGKVWTVDS